VSKFIIVPFDEMAAIKCGELIYLSLNDEELIKYRTEQRVYKNKIKFDCMLAAIAITRGVAKIYSNDTDMKKFAHGQIDVVPMPVFTKKQGSV
jgi:predicted nucleic acid-binding protein